MEGGRAGPGGDCEAIGDVGSFTKRSEVKRRATSHGSLFILWNCPLSRWHYITSPAGTIICYPTGTILRIRYPAGTISRLPLAL